MSNEELSAKVELLVAAMASLRPYLDSQDKQIDSLLSIGIHQQKQIKQLAAQVAALKARFN